MTVKKTTYLKAISIIASVIPLLWLIYLVLSDQLGADPAKDIQHFTGTTTINFLMAVLLLSPLIQIFHWNVLNGLKRTMGLITFFWAVAHVLSYFVFELASDIPLFFNEIFSRAYLTIGFIAWFGLFLLAITSNKLSMKILKKNWKRLHNLIYPIAILCATHYYIALKVKNTTPIYYVIIFIILWINHLIRRHKKSVKSPRH